MLADAASTVTYADVSMPLSTVTSADVSMPLSTVTSADVSMPLSMVTSNAVVVSTDMTYVAFYPVDVSLMADLVLNSRTNVYKDI